MTTLVASKNPWVRSGIQRQGCWPFATAPFDHRFRSSSVRVAGIKSRLCHWHRRRMRGWLLAPADPPEACCRKAPGESVLQGKMLGRSKGFTPQNFKSASDNSEWRCFGWETGTRRASKVSTSVSPVAMERQRWMPSGIGISGATAGLLPLGFVVTGVTARCGDAPPVPPRPKPKSQAAAPLPIFRRALRQFGPNAKVEWLNLTNEEKSQLEVGNIDSQTSGVGDGSLAFVGFPVTF